jgi:hypothetical protein
MRLVDVFDTVSVGSRWAVDIAHLASDTARACKYRKSPPSAATDLPITKPSHTASKPLPLLGNLARRYGLPQHSACLCPYGLHKAGYFASHHTYEQVHFSPE